MVRLVISALLFLLSLTAVVPAQTINMWRVSVVATGGGHIVALLALIVLLVPGWRHSRLGLAAAALSAITLIISLTPVVFAFPVASSLPVRMRTAFGESLPRSLPGAPPRSRALSVASLYSKIPAPEVTVITLPYVVRDGTPINLDLYRRDDSPLPRPIVVTIPGGSWRGGSRTDLAALNRYLAARGYAVAAISYRFAPRYWYPAQTDDTNAAIDYLKQNARTLGVDPNMIVLVGRSAGGQMALQSAYRNNDPAIRGVVSLYGPTDQLWGWNHPTNPRVYDTPTTLRDFLHGTPAEVPQAYFESSALNFVGPSTVPTLLIHGGADPLVSLVQSQRLDSALAAAGRPHLLVELPWATHACDYVFNGPCAQVATYAIERFLASVMN
ncbi:MAG: alpha/beta hydrolase [Gemmatimonadaceae bacterium]